MYEMHSGQCGVVVVVVKAKEMELTSSRTTSKPTPLVLPRAGGLSLAALADVREKCGWRPKAPTKAS